MALSTRARIHIAFLIYILLPKTRTARGIMRDVSAPEDFYLRPQRWRINNDETKRERKLDQLGAANFAPRADRARSAPE